MENENNEELVQIEEVQVPAPGTEGEDDELKVRTLPELEEVLPPLKVEQFESLKASIAAEGLRDRLVVWGMTDPEPILVDGFSRYRALKELGIKLTEKGVIRMDFTDISEAVVWVLRNQTTRRNMSVPEKCVAALKSLPHLKRVGERRMREGSGDDPKRHDTYEEATRPLHLGSSTFKKWIVDIEKVDEGTVRKLKSGELKISAVHKMIKAIEKVDPEIMKRVKSGEIDLLAAYETIQKQPETKQPEGQTEKDEGTEGAGAEGDSGECGEGDEGEGGEGTEGTNVLGLGEEGEEVLEEVVTGDPAPQPEERICLLIDDDKALISYIKDGRVKSVRVAVDVDAERVVYLGFNYELESDQKPLLRPYDNIPAEVEKLYEAKTKGN